MKKELLIICSILLLATISAQIIISPDPIDISQTVKKIQNYSIIINNTYDFDVFSFKFGNLANYGFIIPKINISKNSQQTFIFQVNPQNSLKQTLNNLIEFKYFVSLPEEITTYEVLIKENGFTPNYLVIREGDSVKWINQDDIIHEVFTQFFSEQISPNQSYTYTFNQKGVYAFKDPFWDEYFSFNGDIEVINRTSQEKVHNPNYDFTWTTNLDYKLNPTQLQVTLYDTNFEVGATSSVEGSLKILNIGNETAERINLSSDSDWIKFDENNFNLITGEYNTLTYKIQPIIFNTEDTNKTYNFKINIESSNSEKYTNEIIVFIPYKKIEEGFDTETDFLLWFENVFCPAHPYNYFCNPNQTIIIEGNGTSNQTFPVNISEASWEEIKRELARQGTYIIRNSNDLVKLAEYLNVVNQNMNLTNQSLMLQEKNEKKQRATNNTIAFILFFIGLTGLTIYLINLYGKLKKKKAFFEGPYKTKYR